MPTAFTEAWSDYWAQGVVHSCVGTYGDNYGGALGDFWMKTFSGLPGGARVLDIATGNGALPRLLLSHAKHCDVQCDAIDLAAIQPNWFKQLAALDSQRLRFYGGVDAAHLPFANGSFDLVVSQYGIEYSNLEKSIPEVCRVTCASGRIAFIAHHGNGRPVRLAQTEQTYLDWLLAEQSLFDAASLMIEPMARAATAEGRASLGSDANALRAREHFNALLSQLSHRAATGENSDVLLEARDHLMSILADTAAQGLDISYARMAAIRRTYEFLRQRLHDLTQHALDEPAAKELGQQLKTWLGRDIQLQELHDQGYLMGWSICSLP